MNFIALNFSLGPLYVMDALGVFAFSMGSNFKSFIYYLACKGKNTRNKMYSFGGLHQKEEE